MLTPSDEYSEGYQAALRDEPITANPYARMNWPFPFHQKNTDWEKGYKDAWKHSQIQTED